MNIKQEAESLAEDVARLSLVKEADKDITAKRSASATSSLTPGADRRAAAGYIPPHRRQKQTRDHATQAIGMHRSISTLLHSKALGCLKINSC